MMELIAKTDEMRSMARQILAELQKPGVSAAATLKVAIAPSPQPMPTHSTKILYEVVVIPTINAFIFE